jgi:hypothetical protein
MITCKFHDLKDRAEFVTIRQGVGDSCVKSRVIVGVETAGILNDQWPRSDTLRYKSIDESSDEFPMSVVVLRTENEVVSVIAYAKLAIVQRTARLDAVHNKPVLLIENGL